jgi:5-methylcytosine-specific restriction endonuclease McrA
VKRLTRETIARLMAKQLSICPECRKWLLPGEPFHVDHKVAIANGGGHSEENLQVLHALCNLRKSDRIR